MTRFGVFGAALGFGLLYAWMEVIAVRLSAFASPASFASVYFFLACLALTLFVAGSRSLQPAAGRFRGEIPVAGCVLMSVTPVLLAAADFLPHASFSFLSSVAVAFGGMGAALLLWRLGVLLSTFEPDDIAVAFCLSSFVPTAASAAVSGGTPVAALLFVAPPVTLYLLSALSAAPEDAPSLPRNFPLVDLALLLFCLHLAITVLSPVVPGGWDVWVHPFATAFAALVFRFHRGADLPGFYRNALPIIGAAVFLSGFFPANRIALVFAGGGTALLELYAWLLLMYVASASGAKRDVVVARGLFVIVCATVAASAPAGGGGWRIMAFAFPLAILLALIAVWRRCGGILLRPVDPSVPSQNVSDPEDAPAGDPPEAVALADDVKKLARFGLTSRETDVALLLLKGFRDASICSSLFISRNTLKYHLRNIYRKTETGNRRELREVVG